MSKEWVSFGPVPVVPDQFKEDRVRNDSEYERDHSRCVRRVLPVFRIPPNKHLLFEENS